MCFEITITLFILLFQCQLWNATESIQITNKTVESIDYGEGYFDLEPVEDGTNFTMSLLVRVSCYLISMCGT